jgi:hypothetical protein
MIDLTPVIHDLLSALAFALVLAGVLSFGLITLNAYLTARTKTPYRESPRRR